MPIVREFARLTLDPSSGSLDVATIPPSAFQWLVEHALGGPLTPGLVSLEGPRSLKVLNYVGVLETPCGTRLEILPKYTEADESVEDGRRLLVSMVMEALQLKPRQGTMSEISTFKLPLPEWLASRIPAGGVRSSAPGAAAGLPTGRRARSVHARIARRGATDPLRSCKRTLSFTSIMTSFRLTDRRTA